MAKQTRDTQIVSTKGGKLMQRESIDDTLLPDADELKKYKEIDPKVLDFILSRTSIEQDFRHQFNEKALAEQTTNNGFELNDSGGFRSDTLSI